MAASRIFRSVLDVIPDCNRRFLGELVRDMVKQYSDVVAQKRRFLNVPSCPNNFQADLEIDDDDYDVENLENDIECSENELFPMVQLVLERLLVTPNYPKRVQRRALSALDLDNRKRKLDINELVVNSKENKNELLPIAVGGVDRPLTADPGLIPVNNASSEFSNGTSPTDMDDPNFMPELYKEEAMQLLTNEFRWLFVNAIKSALKLNGGEYLGTRAFLLDLIGPELAAEEVNIAAIDPVLPQYPRRIDTVLTKAKGRSHIVKGENKFELLKIARKVSPVAINVTHPRLATELAKLRTQKSKSDPVTCLICEDETTVDTLVTCVEGHIYCHTCLIDYVKAKVQDGVKQGYLECMQHECSAPFSQNVLTQRLPNDLMEKLDERIAMANLNQANIADLVRCPKCQMVFELESSVQVLHCPVCKHESCRQCHQPWNDEHRGKKCEELETLDEAKIRQLFEERMTAELIRPCPTCRTPLMKNEGCNKLTCACKATLCYVCREPFIGYDHFCQHPRNPGQPCDQCTKCSLWIDPAAEDAARIKRIDEEAKAALERQKNARLNEADLGLGVKKQTSSDPVDIVSAALTALNLSAKPVQLAPAPVNAELNFNVALNDVFLVVDRNDIPGVERLVQQFGARILNHQEQVGNREFALHRAASLGHFDMVQALLRLGADVHLNWRNLTALHVATLNNFTEIMDELIGAGADINVRAHDMATPLHMAVRSRKVDAARLLIERGANLELRDSFFGQTPLHFAAHHGHLQIATLLINKGADVRARDSRTGGTPLHHAASSGAVDVVRILLKKGAGVNDLNKARRTPLHMCAFRGPGNCATARVLIEAGADVFARDVTNRDVRDNCRVSFKRDIEQEIVRAQQLKFRL